MSWYGLPESDLVVLHVDGMRRINLLVVPPDTPESVAIAAMLMASAPGNRRTPADVLKAAAMNSRPQAEPT